MEVLDELKKSFWLTMSPVERLPKILGDQIRLWLIPAASPAKQKREVQEVCSDLDKKKRGAYCVFNFAGIFQDELLAKCSSGQVVDFSKQNSVENFSFLMEICILVQRWVSADRRQFAVLSFLEESDDSPHVDNSALVCACLLIFAGARLASGDVALEHVEEKLGLQRSRFFGPSQESYVNYFYILFQIPALPNTKRLNLFKISLHNLQDSGIRRDSLVVQVEYNTTTKFFGADGAWYADQSGDADSATLDLQCSVFGDFSLVVWKYDVIDDDKPVRIPLLRFAFSTIFVHQEKHRIKRREMDYAQWIDALPDDFYVVLYFASVDKPRSDDDNYVKQLEQRIEQSPKHQEIVQELDLPRVVPLAPVRERSQQRRERSVRGGQHQSVRRSMSRTPDASSIDDDLASLDQMSDATDDLFVREHSTSLSSRPARSGGKALKPQHEDARVQQDTDEECVSCASGAVTPTGANDFFGMRGAPLSPMSRLKNAFFDFTGGSGGSAAAAASPPPQIPVGLPPPGLPPPAPLGVSRHGKAPPPPLSMPPPPLSSAVASSSSSVGSSSMPPPAPPPLGKSKGSPPPPPPPPPPGGKGSPPPPPPPGKLSTAAVAVAAAVYTGPKLKSFFWTKVPRPCGVWSVRDDAVVKAVVDEAFLVEMLSVRKKDKAAQPKASGDGGAVGENGTKTKKKSQVVTGQRLQNIGITLKKLKRPKEDIAAALLCCDTSTISGDMLDMIAAILPTQEEVALLQAELSKDAFVWTSVEDFLFYVGSRVKDGKERIQLWRATLEYDELVELTVRSMDVIEKAISALTKKNSRFAHVLRSVLAMGNLMNRGTSHGDAVGFRMDNLSMLSLAKSSDGKTTLLEMLVLMTEGSAAKNAPMELSNFPDDLRCVNEAMNCPLAVLTQQVTQLTHTLQKMRKVIDKKPATAPKTSTEATAATSSSSSTCAAVEVVDMLPALLSACTHKYTARVAELAMRHQSIREDVGSMMEYYGEDAATEETVLWNMVATFAKEFEAMREHLRKLKRTKESLLAAHQPQPQQAHELPQPLPPQ